MWGNLELKFLVLLIFGWRCEDLWLHLSSVRDWLMFDLLRELRV